MQYYLVFTAKKRDCKKRNTILFYDGYNTLIIDPQLEAVDWIRQKINKFPVVGKMIILLSHEHDNHFTGLSRLLMDNPGIIPILIFPESIAAMIDRQLMERVLPYKMTITDLLGIVKDQFYRKDELAGSFSPGTHGIHFIIEPVSGHCRMMLQVSLVDAEKKKKFVFPSDNVTIGFPPPIIKPGGSLTDIRRYYRKLLADMDEYDTCIIPGHGNVAGRDYIQILEQYFLALPDLDWESVPGQMKDPALQEIGKIFHSINTQLSQE